MSGGRYVRGTFCPSKKTGEGRVRYVRVGVFPEWRSVMPEGRYIQEHFVLHVTHETCYPPERLKRLMPGFSLGIQGQFHVLGVGAIRWFTRLQDLCTRCQIPCLNAAATKEAA